MREINWIKEWRGERKEMRGFLIMTLIGIFVSRLIWAEIILIQASYPMACGIK